jgi:hypothetical protein
VGATLRLVDSSIDELMSSREIVCDGQLRPGPVARTVLVFETPAAALTLKQRIEAHLVLIRRLTALLATANAGKRAAGNLRAACATSVPLAVPRQ